jgi:cobalt/nickel transport system ATP-binding protein
MGPEVFSDVELIKRARLKLPMVMDLYKELVSRGLLNGSKPPRNIVELTDLLESGDGRKGSRRTLGKIYICNVDDRDPAQIKRILEKLHVGYTGAMGTNAKMIAEQARIPLDFTYGVIDKCLLKALIGKDSLIMTSGAMVKHSMGRIRAYGEDSGAVIEVVDIHPEESGVNSERQRISSQKESIKPIEAAQ